MYTFLSIVLYIIAAIMVICSFILLGKALFRNRDSKALSLESELHIDPHTSQPVIPRHVRNQLEETQAEQENISQQNEEHKDVQNTATTTPVEPVINHHTDDEPFVRPTESKTENVADETPTVMATEQTETELKPEILQLNPDIEVKEVEAFQGDSELLIANLDNQDDDESEEYAEQVMEFYVYLDDHDLKGDRFLKILDRYGLRFGEENYFHRYHQDENGDFYHMFSLAKRTYDGKTEPFDINTMVNEPINAVVFFLTLPHYDAVTGYDMMMTSMHRMTRELKGRIFDGHRNELTSQMEQDLRSAIKMYVSEGQS